MKITKISVYKTHLPYVGGVYAWGAGNKIDVATASIVVVETDAGLTGCGEFTPCGENYGLLILKVWKHYALDGAKVIG